MIASMKKNYHWVIAVVLFLEMAVFGGIVNNIYGMFLIPVSESLGISRTAFAVSNSAKSVGSFAALLVSGAIFHRFGCKRSTIAGLFVTAFAMVLMTFAQNLWMIIVGSTLLGMSEAFCLMGVVSIIVGRWFHSHQGMVIGVISAGTGIGGSLICVLLSKVMEVFGWSGGYAACGIMAAGVGLLLMVTLYNTPEERGLKPYGMGRMPKQKKHHKEEDHWDGYSMAQLCRMPAFYLLLLGFFMATLAVNGAFGLVIPHFQTQGLTTEQTTVLQSATLITLSVSKFLFGYLSDTFGARAVAIGAMTLAIFSLFLMSVATTFPLAIISVVLMTFSLPTTTVVIPLITYPLFGYRSHDASLGIFLSMVSVGQFLNGPVANAVYDWLGTYVPVLQVSSALAFVTVVVFGTVFLLCKRKRKAFDAAQFAAK